MKYLDKYQRQVTETMTDVIKIFTVIFLQKHYVMVGVT